MMKSLVVYYSHTGNTELIAKTIADELNADVLRINPKKEVTKSFMKYVWGGKQVIMREKPELMKLGKNLEKYDLVVIGTPVWAGTFSPPIRTLLSGKKIAGKKIALFCTHQGRKIGCLSNMEKELPENRILSKMDFFKPLKSKEQNKKIARIWAKRILESAK